MVIFLGDSGERFVFLSTAFIFLGFVRFCLFVDWAKQKLVAKRLLLVFCVQISFFYDLICFSVGQSIWSLCHDFYFIFVLLFHSSLSPHFFVLNLYVVPLSPISSIYFKQIYFDCFTFAHFIILTKFLLSKTGTLTVQLLFCIFLSFSFNFNLNNCYRVFSMKWMFRFDIRKIAIIVLQFANRL